MVALDLHAPTAEEKAEIRRRKGAITRRIKRQVLAKYGLQALPKQGDRVLVTGGQGTGKSRTCAEKIGELRGDTTIWWLVPTLGKAEEQVAEYTERAGAGSMKARVVCGRSAPDPRTNGADAMCPRHLVATRAAAAGVNVQKAICENGCPLRATCGYQRQAAELLAAPNGLFIMASDYLWLPSPAPRTDLVIVDESVMDKATDRVSFDPSRIVADELWAGGILEEALGRRRLALLVRAAVTEHRGRELAFLREHDVTVEAVRESIKHLSSQGETPPAVDGRMSDKKIADILNAFVARENLKVLKLFRQIKRELPQPRTRLNGVWFDADAEVMVDGENERQPRVFVSSVRKPRPAKAIPVLCLDGTGSIDLNRKIFGDHMTLERFAVPRDAEVYQVTSKTFSRQSITGTDHKGNPISPKKTYEAARLRSQVLDLLKMLPGKVLLVTYKQAEEILRPELPPHVEVAHFGALRGLNAYEHCETAVVLGRPQPSEQDLETQTRPFCATDAEPFIPMGEYVLQSRGRRMRIGGPNVAEVQVHPDTRCQTFLEQIREAETVQAIDRVRPVFDRRRIIVLTSVALDMSVDHALTWPELRPGKFAHAFARLGVLPLSAGDLCRGFPDLWPTLKDADNALAPLRKNLESPNKNSIRSFKVVFRECRLATYRRAGQRGPVARALVAAALPDPRAVLESLVGELTEFHVARPSEPPADVRRPEPAQALPPLPPLAAALSSEAHLLATLPPDARPSDMLGIAGAFRLMALKDAAVLVRWPHDCRRRPPGHADARRG
jgi:hypothetical protein